MSGCETHCKDCLDLLGKDFAHVHMWLDRFARDLPPPVFFDYHRSLRHNSYGLSIIRARWGEEAYEAGRIHLARDYDDTCPVDKLLDRAPAAIMWFNNLENLEMMIQPRYMQAWEESLMAMLEEKEHENNDI